MILIAWRVYSLSSTCFGHNNSKKFVRGKLLTNALYSDSFSQHLPTIFGSSCRPRNYKTSILHNLISGIVLIEILFFSAKSNFSKTTKTSEKVGGIFCVSWWFLKMCFFNETTLSKAGARGEWRLGHLNLWEFVCKPSVTSWMTLLDIPVLDFIV